MPEAVALRAGELEASFLPGAGMVCVSLRHRGEELLGRVGELDRYLEHGSTVGIPLLHPWANRLAGLSYRAAGQKVELDRGSRLLHFDANRLPIHGVPGANLAWDAVDSGDTTLVASLSWDRAELLEVFPYPHVLTMRVGLTPQALHVETELEAGGADVPVAFGYHPYLSLPGAGRESWTVELPPMRRLELDERGIPTGREAPFAGLRGPLERDYDDAFGGLPAGATFAASGGGRRVEVRLVRGYAWAQVFAPPGEDVVCFEPMTAPANALASGQGLAVLPAGGRYEAAFRIAVSAGS